MSSSKRQANGRSPLVNPQRQITSFFSKTTSPSPVTSKLNPKLNPNPSSKCSPSPDSVTTPSPYQSKIQKPRLLISRTPSPPLSSTPATTKSYGEEAVGKRVRVYWPLDQAWYEGCVSSFDTECNKHMIQYEDGEEELLDLGKEKFEWVQGTITGFKRLRRGSSVAFRKMVIEDDEEINDAIKENSDCKSDSSDDDWDKKAEKEQTSEDEEVDLEDEQEVKMSRGKLQKVDGEGKKSKNGVDVVKGGFKVSVPVLIKNTEGKYIYSILISLLRLSLDV